MARQHYNLILQLFQWMNIDESTLLYGKIGKSTKTGKPQSLEKVAIGY